MTRLFFWLAVFSLLAGAPAMAGLFTVAAVVTLIGWLLLGPKSHLL